MFEIAFLLPRCCKGKKKIKKKPTSPTQLFWLLQNPAKPELSCSLWGAVTGPAVLSGHQDSLCFLRTLLEASSLTAPFCSSVQQLGNSQEFWPITAPSHRPLSTAKTTETSEEGVKIRQIWESTVFVSTGDNEQVNNPSRSISSAAQTLVQPGHSWQSSLWFPMGFQSSEYHSAPRQNHGMVGVDKGP